VALFGLIGILVPIPNNLILRLRPIINFKALRPKRLRLTFYYPLFGGQIPKGKRKIKPLWFPLRFPKKANSQKGPVGKAKNQKFQNFRLRLTQGYSGMELSFNPKLGIR